MSFNSLTENDKKVSQEKKLQVKQYKGQSIHWRFGSHRPTYAMSFNNGIERLERNEMKVCLVQDHEN